MNLEQHLRDLLRDQAAATSFSAILPPRTWRRARLQRAVVAASGALTVALLAAGGLAVTGNLGVTRSVGPNDVGGSSRAPGEVARGTIGDRSWVLSLSTGDGCIELSFESPESGGVAMGSGGTNCAAGAGGSRKNEGAAPPMNLVVSDYGNGPHRVVVYGNVGPEVDRLELRGDDVVFEPPLYDAPAGVDTERRFFITFLPIESQAQARFDRIVAVSSDGSVLDRQEIFYEAGPLVGQSDPSEILSEGRVRNRNYVLRVWPAPGQSCFSFEIVGVPDPGERVLCQDDTGATMTVMQQGYARSRIAPVYGMLPEGTDHVVLELEDGTTVEGEVVPAPDGYPKSFYLLFAPSIESRGQVLAFAGDSRVPLDVIELCLPDGIAGAGGGHGDASASSCSSNPGP